MFSGWSSSSAKANLSDRQTASDTVERLCDRLKTATMMEDRRNAVQALKEHTRLYQLEVGTLAMPVLLEFLQVEDVELLNDVLETLIAICSPMPEETSEAIPLAVQFTEIFVKHVEHVSHLLTLIDAERDIYTRYYAVQLTLCLVRNKPNSVKQSILKSTVGLSKIVDLLQEQKEAVRNEGILLLAALTEANTEIQKIVVFGNAFERLFDLVEQEESTDAELEVALFLPSQCFKIMKNLLEYNVSNQSYFRETNGIQRLVKLLRHFCSHDTVTEDRSAMLISYILDVVRLLVVPDNPNTDKNQTLFGKQESIFSCLVSCIAVPRIASSSLSTMGLLIRSHAMNQKSFASLKYSSSEHSFRSSMLSEACRDYPIAALLAICYLVLDKSIPLPVRFASLQVFQHYCVDNKEGQLAIASTWVPTPTSMSIGSLILSVVVDGQTLAARDPTRHWFACLLLSYCLHGNEATKQMAINYVIDERFPDAEGMSLMVYIMYLLIQTSQEGSDARVLCGLYTLMIVWLNESPVSVQCFLSESSHVHFLIEKMKHSSVSVAELQGLATFLFGLIMEYNDNSHPQLTIDHLYSIVVSRIGIDVAVSRLIRLRETPAWQHLADVATLWQQKSKEDEPHIYFDEVLLLILKSKMDSIQKRFVNKNTLSSSDSLTLELNETIKHQASELDVLKKQMQSLQSSYDDLKREHDDLLVCLAELDMDNRRMQEKLAKLNVSLPLQQEIDAGSKAQQGLSSSYAQPTTAVTKQAVHKIPPFLMNPTSHVFSR